MLVFLSDVHLTDGSSGETIKPSAFKLFADQLIKLADSVNPLREIKIVLLGDIFDVIRSAEWLNDGNTVRPWDPSSNAQQTIVTKILEGILANNRAALNSFKDIKTYADNNKLLFEMIYIIGNHDWLINRYDNCRQLVANALGIAGGGATPFPTELFAEDYRVQARHGDIHDKFNFMGHRDASSIGDAIVIELLNRYPLEVKKRLATLVAGGNITSKEQDNIVAKLKEIDNLRPLLEAPSWVLMLSASTANSDASEAIKDAWEQCVDDFFKVKFIKDQDKFLWPDTIDYLQIALQLSSHLSKQLLEKIVEFKERFFSGGIEGDYHKAAFKEPLLSSGQARYVVYGHTHDHLIVPLDQVSLTAGTVMDKVYFNTGTWRKTWNKVMFDHQHREFIGWHVLTYVAFFNSNENGDYNFEVWNGSLG